MRKTQLVITEPFEKLTQEKITFTDVTLLRLMKLGADALALYIHYCLTAKLQSKTHGQYVNPVKATSSYVMKGLNLSSDRFGKAKKLLLKNRFIEDYDPRNEKGQFKGHYIKIHYFFKNADDVENVHPPENPEGGLSKEWETQRLENQETNTNDKKGNTKDKKINTNNKSIVILQEDSLLMQETNAPESTPAPTHNFITESSNHPTEEEEKAQEIIDAIKTECGLDLKDPKKWTEQIIAITDLLKELSRDKNDFVKCVKNLQKNTFYKQIPLNTVLKTIRIMSPNILRNNITSQEELDGLTVDAWFEQYYIQEAQRNKTTPEIEKAKYEKQLKEREDAIARGEPV